MHSEVLPSNPPERFSWILSIIHVTPLSKISAQICAEWFAGIPLKKILKGVVY